MCKYNYFPYYCTIIRRCNDAIKKRRPYLKKTYLLHFYYILSYNFLNFLIENIY